MEQYRYRIMVIALVAYIFFRILKRLYARVKKERRYKQYLNSPLADVDRMQGEEFEEYLAAHFRHLGYQVKLTPKSNDFGADLIIKKDGITIVVQAKRYQGKVGIKAIQEIIGAKGFYAADQMMVVSNSFYTSGAEKLAKANNVQLWNRNTINNLFLEGNKEGRGGKVKWSRKK